MTAPISYSVPPPQVEAASPSKDTSPTSPDKMWDQDGFSFGDVLDAINPLQHIPIVNSIYRKISGDEIGLAPQIAGGILSGVATMGLSAGVQLALTGTRVADFIVDKVSGDDMGGHLMAWAGTTTGQEPEGTVYSGVDSPPLAEPQPAATDTVAMVSGDEMEDLAATGHPQLPPAPTPQGFGADPEENYRVYAGNQGQSTLGEGISSALQQVLWDNKTMQVAIDRYQTTAESASSETGQLDSWQ